MKIYIAGPFFKSGETEELTEMIQWVKDFYPDAELFIPKDHFIENGEKLPNHEWAKKVFDMDVDAINKSDMIIALYSSHYSDTGTAWEIGYAYALKKPIYLWIPKSSHKCDMSIMPINSAKILNCAKVNLNQK